MKKNDAVTKGLVECINPIVLKIMKISFFLILVCTFSVNAAGFSQTRISLSAKDASIRNVIREIESKSDFTFFYNEDFLDLNKTVTYKADNESVVDVLGNIAEKTGLEFKVLENNLVVITNANQVQKTISGKVTNEKGEPLPGVTVVLKGTTNGTNTDANGNYSISVPNEATILVFSYIGMISQEITVGTTAVVNVVLKEAAVGLSEVVVIGYGSQRMAAVTGSISKVSGKDIASMPVVSVDQALQGKVAGVSVTNNGSPGSSPIIQIRGIGSINFGSDPLYVVDGVPTGSINNVSSSDIESMDILKDASATAIYGSRGSNGVVIITTKQGKSEKYQIDYDGYAGSQKAWKLLPLLNTDQYLKYGKMMEDNAGSPYPARWSNMNDPIYAGASQTWAQTNTDWSDAMFRTAVIQSHSLAISGGNTKSKFYSSAAYFNQDGIMIGTYYKRLNYRLNSNHEISKRIKFGQTLSLAQDENQGEVEVGARPQILNMQRMLPYMPLHDPTRDGGYRSPDGADGTDPDNPVRAALHGYHVWKTFRLLGSAFADVKLMDGLNYKSTVSLDYSNDRFNAFSPTFNEGTFHSSSTAGVEESRGNTSSWLFQNQLTYDHTFGKHYINATAVVEQTKTKYFGLSGYGDFPDNTLEVIQGPTTYGVNSYKSEDVLISYIGRVQYSYADKYLLSASLRSDGSSKFAPGNKWGAFKSFSAGWRVKQESFLKDVSAISDLKLKASYGETGFNGIGNYVWQTQLNAGGTFYNFVDNDMQGAFFNQLGNKDLKWETTNMTNFGFDVKFLENALSLSAEYYDRETSNMLLIVNPAPSMGYWNGTYTNIGKMSNKGFEVSLGYTKKINDIAFSVNGNISSNKNKVVKLDLPTSEIYAGTSQDYGDGPITITKEGLPIQQFYGYKVDHIIQVGETHPTMPDAEPGDILFQDISGKDGIPDGNVDDYDRTVIGNPLPKFTYGFNLSVSYKGFDLTAFLQGTYGNKIFNANRVILEGMTRLFNAGPEVLNAWTPQNTNTSQPRAIDGDPNKNSRVSDRWVEDGSYLRVKSLMLGYTVPAAILKTFTKGTCKNLKFYVSAQNLLTFTKYKGYDPEIGQRGTFGNYTATWGILSQGVDYGQFPQPRTFIGGVQVSF